MKSVITAKIFVESSTFVKLEKKTVQIFDSHDGKSLTSRNFEA